MPKCSSEVMSEEPHFPVRATARVIVMVEKMREKSRKNLKDITGTKKCAQNKNLKDNTGTERHSCNDIANI